jgi:hypothetical protein
MAKHTSNASHRADAFSDFKAAQKMLSEGEAELASAQSKISLARELLAKSTDVIRSTWISNRAARQGKK